MSCLFSTAGITLTTDCLEDSLLTCYWGCSVQKLYEALEWLFQFVWGHVSDFLKLIHILLGYFSYNVCKIRISFLKMLTVLVINLVNTFKIMNGYGAGGGGKTWLGLQIQLEKSNLLYSEINNFLTKGLEVCISFYSLES